MAEVLCRSDPSWWPRFLTIIDRDYPDLAQEILSRAITENFEEIKARKAREEASRG